jgi:hypothetical protein
MKLIKSYVVFALFLCLSVVALAAGTTDSNFEIGNKTAGDRYLKFRKGAGSTQPAIRWNNALNVIEFSHDGTTYEEIGTGGGAGGGGGVLLNENPGFEDDLENWAETGGGTLAVVTASANVGFGLQAASFDASTGGDYLQGQTVAVPAGLANKTCTISWYYKGGDANLVMQVYDVTNTAVWAESSALSAQTGYSAKQVLYFTCPDEGVEIAPRLAATADAAIVYVDEVRLGQETVVTGSSAAWVGSITYLATASCDWSVNSTTIQTPAADTDCPTPTIDGNTSFVSAPGTKIPAIVLSNVKAGETYEFVVTGEIRSNTSGLIGKIRVSDGTDHSSIASFGEGGSGVASTGTYTGRLTFSTGGTKTVNLQVSISNVSGSAVVAGSWSDFRIDVKKFPLAGEDAISIDKSGWRIDANLGGGLPALSTSAVSSYTEITNASLDLIIQSGSASAEVPCSSTNPSTGVTCAAGSESLGIVFTPPTAGTYEVCGQFTQEMDLASGAVLQTAFQFVETPNNAQTILQESKSYAQSGQQISAGSLTQYPYNLCGTFTFSDTSKRTIRLMYEQAVSGTVNDTTIMIDRSASLGQRDMKITVRRKVEFQDAIRLTYPTPRSEVAVDTGNGAGAVATYIRRFTNIRRNEGTAITYADSVNDGGTFTINEDGVYCSTWTDRRSAGVMTVGISVNTNSPSTNLTALNYSQGFRGMFTGTGANPTAMQWCGWLEVGDVVRAHLSDTTSLTSEAQNYFQITQVSK